MHLDYKQLLHNHRPKQLSKCADYKVHEFFLSTLSISSADVTKVTQPQEDTLSNQTSEPDINREVLKYIAIGIFLGAFLFPILLGICCFYCSHEDSQEEETALNHAPNVEHTISVVGRNPSESVTELTSEDVPPSYDACNETFETIQEEDEM